MTMHLRLRAGAAPAAPSRSCRSGLHFRLYPHRSFLTFGAARSVRVRRAPVWSAAGARGCRASLDGPAPCRRRCPSPRGLVDPGQRDDRRSRQAAGRRM